MRALLFALASTAAGLAALLSFKTHSSAAGTTAAAPATGTQGGSASASASTGAGSAGTASGGGVAGSGSPAPRGSTAGSAATRTVTGAVANTQYGPMQVQVTLLGRKITGVKVLQQTNVGTESQQIDANSIPQLTRETLAAQSARINAVSGASYTSAGYTQSLQSALNQATA